MFASASGELKTRALPNFRCRFAVTLKTPPLPLTVFEVLFARTIGHVFAEHDDARIARHLGVETTIDQVDHRSGIAGKLERRLQCRTLSTSDRRRAKRHTAYAFRRGLRTRECLVRRFVHFSIDFVLDSLQSVLIDHAFVDQNARQNASPDRVRRLRHVPRPAR